jgi:CDP-4-dehydro-6-deoxyglucose reductase
MEMRLPPNDAMHFVAGQYVEFILEDGKRRPYSIANSPRVEGVVKIELHLRHSPGGLFTDRVFSSLKLRDLLKIEGPLGTFILRESSTKPIIMVASGTGFAPIKAMLETAFHKGLNVARPIEFYWGGRSKQQLYQLELCRQWARENVNFAFVPVLSEPSPDCAWAGRTGFVHQAVMEDHRDLASYEVYACGAPVMVEAARRDFQLLCGLPNDMFFADEFITEAERHLPVSEA